MFKQSSLDNMYSSTYYTDVKRDELIRGTKMYNKAQNPMETGIVPRPAFASMFSQIDDTNDNLSGMQMDRQDYTHNNMVPFLKGNVTQNVDVERMSNYTDRMSGNDSLYMKKQEVPCLFKPTINDQVCSRGMQNNDEFLKSRVVDPLSRNNEFPIQQIRVGPGLNRGYSSAGVGGFQQSDTLKYAAPPDLQANKPKTDQTSKTFKIPFQGPKTNNVTKRSMTENVVKNLPERTFEQNKENFFVTTGAYSKPTERGNQNIKETNAPLAHIEYTGGAKDTVNLQNTNDDYGKANVVVYDNERNNYETKTVVTNLTSLVNAVVNPLVDTMKNSIKEYLIDAPRQEGMMNPQMPQAVTVHDPNDITRTTIKETTIHDSEKLNLKGEDGTYTALQDDIKTTTKETTIHDAEKLNLKGEDGTYTALQDDAKTTTKETLLHDAQQLNVKAGEGTYTEIQDKARTTTNETLGVKDVYRNIGGVVYRTVSYSTDLVAKTTTKETTIHKSEGFLGGILEGLFGGYLSSNPFAKDTNKQSTHEQYIGTGNTNVKEQMSHLATDNAEIDGTREKMLIDAGHIPNGGQSSLSKINNGTINMKANKSIVESLAPRKIHNVEKIYQTTPNSNINGITKESSQLNSYENRLDKNTLSSLKNNPFNIQVNPI
tara:strand:- start:3946 stop:5910 length:1965 start_codon:yes stop_codon:yes gene_type:complete